MIQFIRELADYYCKENDISNITCIMCHASEEFKRRFLYFFFPELEIDSVVDIRREIPDENDKGCRVDLFISLHDDDKPYIIEVKKGDRNHHFGQYEEAYGISKDRFGYITNYVCSEGLAIGYDVKTWEEFYDHLISFSYEDELILGYTEYLKSACGLVKYNKPMNFSGISSIKCFADTAKKIVTNGVEGLEITKYTQYCHDCSLHQSFYFKPLGNDSEKGFGILGLWFYEEPVITFGINSRPWLSRAVLEDMNTNWEQFEYLSKPYKDKYWDPNDVWFEMNEKRMREFNDVASYEEQFRILDGFYREALRYLTKFF